MSALSKLVGKPKPWDWFSGRYPIKVKQVNPPASFTQTIKENILNCDRKTYVYGYTDYLKLDARPLLKNISIPVTIIGAGKLYGKEMALKTYKEQYANLTGYTLRINPDAKHFIMMDAPLWLEEQLNRILVK